MLGLFYSQFSYLLSLSYINTYSIKLSKFLLNKSYSIFLSSSVACVPACIYFFRTRQIQFCKEMLSANAAISFQNKSVLVLLPLSPEPRPSISLNVFSATKSFTIKVTLFYVFTTKCQFLYLVTLNIRAIIFLLFHSAKTLDAITSLRNLPVFEFAEG